jgi:RecB family endonuclease NucS
LKPSETGNVSPTDFKESIECRNSSPEEDLSPHSFSDIPEVRRKNEKSSRTEVITISERDMEDAIIADPEKFLGEEGLKLISRQYRIGNYIFDLLFGDRHGAKLIVELQKGVLDRNHTYKILDYYHEYKENNPYDFVELMVIANEITKERKKRLSSWGVTCKEIPVSEFPIPTSQPFRDEEKQEIKRKEVATTHDISGEDSSCIASHDDRTASLVNQVRDHPSWRQTHVIDAGIKMGLNTELIANALVITSYCSDKQKAVSRVKRHLNSDPSDRKQKRKLDY